LLADHRQRAVDRAAAPDLDGVAKLGGVGRLAQEAMVEFFAALGRPLQQLHGAVDRDAFLIAGDEERDRACRLPAAGAEVIEARRHRASDGALHVDGAAAVERAVENLAGEGRMRPAGSVARGDHIGVAGEHEVRGAAADAGIEIVDRIGARFDENHAMGGKARALQETFEHAERAGLRRRHRGAAQEFTGKRNGVGGLDHRAPQCAGAAPSGSGPYWFGPTVPRRQPSSTKAQITMPSPASDSTYPMIPKPLSPPLSALPSDSPTPTPMRTPGTR